jgi:ABC-2 type transport system permease protein
VSLFWTFSRQAFFKISAYRANFWTEMFTLFVQIFVVHTLWNVLYRQAPSLFGNVSLTQMVTYGVISIVIGMVLSTDEGPHEYITTQVKTGMITSDLLKPISFLSHMLYRSAGDTIARAVFYMLPPLATAYLILSLRVPASGRQVFLFLLSLVLSYLILFFCNFLFGLIVFKTQDLIGFMFTYWALMRFLSGQFVPLWLYPEWLKPLLYALPFQAIYYTPLAIFVGKLDGRAALQAVGIQACWIVLLFLVSRWVWGRVHRYLTVQGG